MSCNKLSYEVSAEFAGMRVDKYLGTVCVDLSRSRLKTLIEGGGILLNNNILHQSSYKVVEGDFLLIDVPEPEPAEPLPENISLSIVYEDADIIVINKPPGLVVHPGAGNWTGTLVNALLYHCGDSLSGIGGVARPGIVHRLDKDTSGLIMVAKNDHAHQHLSAQLADRSLSRIYHALVFGVPVPIKGCVDRPIGRHRHSRLKMSVMSNAPREARTHYMILENYGDACSLVECKLESGRTHQIRVHMEAIGHPVIGDPLYGIQQTALISKLKNAKYSADITKNIVELNRQMLHAYAIMFIHPVTEEEMYFEADLPDDFSKILNSLNK